MTDYTHLHILELRLSNERARLEGAKSKNEVIMRGVYVDQMLKEIDSERKFLGLPPETLYQGNEDDLLAELFS